MNTRPDDQHLPPFGTDRRGPPHSKAGVTSGGSDVATAGYMTWIWATILRQDADETSRRATIIDPDRSVTDILLLTAAVASLIAVGSLLFRAQRQGAAEVLRVGQGLASVVLPWAMVHTIYPCAMPTCTTTGPTAASTSTPPGARPTLTSPT